METFCTQFCLASFLLLLRPSLVIYNRENLNLAFYLFIFYNLCLHILSQWDYFLLYKFSPEDIFFFIALERERKGWCSNQLSHTDQGKSQLFNMCKCELLPGHHWLTCYHGMCSASNGQGSKPRWTILGLVPSLCTILHINFKRMFSPCAFLYLKCGCIVGTASEVHRCLWM